MPKQPCAVTAHGCFCSLSVFPRGLILISLALPLMQGGGVGVGVLRFSAEKIIDGTIKYLR